MHHRPGTRHVGWLAKGHDVPTMAPTEELLDTLWRFCKVSVAATRGLHDCELCPGDSSNVVQRNGENLLLGDAEIRVLGHAGVIYAAPTLIYHYVLVHHYAPPEEFRRALAEGPTPPDPAYFDWLAELGLAWSPTSAPAEQPARRTLAAPGAKWVRPPRADHLSARVTFLTPEQQGLGRPPRSGLLSRMKVRDELFAECYVWSDIDNQVFELGVEHRVTLQLLSWAEHRDALYARMPLQLNFGHRVVAHGTIDSILA